MVISPKVLEVTVAHRGCVGTKEAYDIRRNMSSAAVDVGRAIPIISMFMYVVYTSILFLLV